MITVFADKYLYDISSFLPDGINLQLYDPEHGLPEQMDGADALLIRTVTKITEKSIRKIPDSLQFIGSGSAGTDHVDMPLLKDRGITFRNAEGCNARSVAEYVATALLIWSDYKKVNLSTTGVGIIGVGKVGSELKNLLGILGIKTLAYDPPRALSDPAFKSASLQEVLGSDILSLHVPLTRESPYPTFHWLDNQKLSYHSYKLIVNTSRGGVVDEQNLLRVMNTGSINDVIIDVWENEPVFNNTLAQRAFISTPHIAGYSIQAKMRASKIIGDALINHFCLSPPDKTPNPSSVSIRPDGDMSKLSPNISTILTNLHPILDYQQRLGSMIGERSNEKAVLFNKLRTEFPLRNEFSTISLPQKLIDSTPVLSKLGFQIT